MRVLITGINGFAGGYLTEYLLHTQQWEIWGLDRSRSLRYDYPAERVRFLQADLCDAAQVAAAITQSHPQVIFHLAGQPFVPESFRDPVTTLHTNVMGLLHIFQAMLQQACKARVLVVGSYEEYGLIRPEDVPIDEATPLRPTNPYGVSKIAQSMLALQYHLSHAIDVVRVRPFNHIGPRQNERFVSASFARQIAAIELGQQPPVLAVGNLNGQRDFTDVRDMVRAYALAAEHGEAGQVYNIGSGTAVMIRHLLDILLAASTTAIAVEQDPQRMRPLDVPLAVCDPRRFCACTGWSAHIPLEQTLHDILEYWRLQVRHEQEKDTR